ncbi:glycosyltransferase family 2 protein [Cylindrospermopsis raciborskii]|uniref:Glycosyltransferase 2-like domain-containing protein n=1 Tax=Cylindrospermopsis raciborskii CENA302 TaxID=1170768 RepID=A0A9Q5WB30_9CYAN|nr:glycosyltransferase family A protein [Cylindrospermopsis raciborskii]OPH11099.1 hypothetical protein CENA302_01835 [Cylindrospermopsis raciborskii CENA302]
MTQTPIVSVVIPTYNRSLEIARCLSSLVSQTFREFEVLVCDDGSTDNTKQVVSTFTETLSIKYFWLDNFGGPARPRNIGIQNARGKYIAFLDSDDWWTPEKLEKSVEALESGADFVYHDLYIVSSNGVMSPFSRKAKTRQVKVPIFNDLLSNGNAINNSSVVVRREFIDSVNGFSEEKALIAAEDYDAWLRVAKYTDKFLKIDGCFGYYSLSNNSISLPDRLINATSRLLNLYNAELQTLTCCPDWASLALADAYYAKGNKYLCISYCLSGISSKLSISSVIYKLKFLVRLILAFSSL